eukprot:jgi/Bigna1/79984/fgenesh1_pg.66_\
MVEEARAHEERDEKQRHSKGAKIQIPGQRTLTAGHESNALQQFKRQDVRAISSPPPSLSGDIASPVWSFSRFSASKVKQTPDTSRAVAPQDIVKSAQTVLFQKEDDSSAVGLGTEGRRKMFIRNAASLNKRSHLLGHCPDYTNIRGGGRGIRGIAQVDEDHFAAMKRRKQRSIPTMDKERKKKATDVIKKMTQKGRIEQQEMEKITSGGAQFADLLEKQLDNLTQSGCDGDEEMVALRRSNSSRGSTSSMIDAEGEENPGDEGHEPTADEDGRPTAQKTERQLL